jgi:hypothetical protein
MVIVERVEGVLAGRRIVSDAIAVMGVSEEGRVKTGFFGEEELYG